MSKTLIYILSVLIMGIFPNLSFAQHYTDWTGFEFTPIDEELYELQKDYTIGLGEYFLDYNNFPTPYNEPWVQALYSEFIITSLPACNWDFVRLDPGGKITVKKGYRWDGPSYPIRPHSYFNYRSSLIHDALYDLMRMEYLQADTNHASGWPHADIHDWGDLGDRNRLMADMMIFMIAVEDGQEIPGLQGAQEDFDIVRYGGAYHTHNPDLLTNWKYHTSKLTATPGDGEVTLSWMPPDFSNKDPNFIDHFYPIEGYAVLRDDVPIGTFQVTYNPPIPPEWITAYIDTTAVNGVAYEYTIIPGSNNQNEWDDPLPDHVIPMTGAGNALYLDGVNDYVEANNVINSYFHSDDYSSGITMEAWVYPEEQALEAVIMGFNTISGGNVGFLCYDGNNHKFAYFCDVYHYSEDVFPANNWYHVAVTRAAGGQFTTLLVNGEIQATFNTAISPSYGSRFSIGQEWDNSNTSQHFKGMIDEARVWCIERLQADIISDMNQALIGNEIGLIALWHCDSPNDYIILSGHPTPELCRFIFDATSNNIDGRLRGYSLAPLDTAFVESGAMGQVGIDADTDKLLPTRLLLAQSFPNPFNNSCRISFTLPQSSHVDVTVYDVLGQEVCCLADDNFTAGRHSVRFYGESLSSGIYFYRIVADDVSQARKMVLLK